MKFYRLAAAFSLIFSISCASRSTVPHEFRSTIRERAGAAASANAATFVIVVDGFGLNTYKQAMRAGNIPEMSKFFTAYRGEAVFPTLTFPNLASIITAATPAQHLISGNQILWKGEARRFDHWRDSGYLNQFLKGSTLFQAIRQRGGTSVSLAYTVSEGATVALKPDIKDGLAYETHQFSYIDGKIADAFEQLVEGPLPDFTFVHFIGVDALSHRFGPEDSRVQAHLRELDSALGRIFHKLRRLEREGIRTRVVLTADHGIVSLRNAVDLEPVLKEACTGAESFNQIRLLTFYGNLSPNCAAQLSRAGGVEVLLFKNLTGYRGGKPVILSQATDSSSLQKFRDFFSSPSAPDAILLPRSGVGFGKAQDFGYGRHLGDHGAWTDEELEVPVLLHGGFSHLQANEAGRIPTHRILKEDLAAWAGNKPLVYDNEWEPKFKFQFELPLQTGAYHSQYLAEEARDYRIALSPRLKTSADLLWSEHWTTRGYYGALFSAHIPAIPGSVGYHELGGSLRYRMHSGTSLFAGYTTRQMPFRTGADSKEDWTKQWVQSLSLGTQAGLLSFGFGELGAKTELAVLLPGKIEKEGVNVVPFSTGLREATSLVFDYDLEARDSVSFELGLTHETQNSAIENREAFSWIFGTSYRLEL